MLFGKYVFRKQYFSQNRIEKDTVKTESMCHNRDTGISGIDDNQRENASGETTSGITPDRVLGRKR